LLVGVHIFDIDMVHSFPNDGALDHLYSDSAKKEAPLRKLLKTCAFTTPLSRWNLCELLEDVLNVLSLTATRIDILGLFFKLLVVVAVLNTAPLCHRSPSIPIPRSKSSNGVVAECPRPFEMTEARGFTFLCSAIDVAGGPPNPTSPGGPSTSLWKVEIRTSVT
jgi:hypothetical protein